MELRPLRVFLVLAEESHFTRAAERLHIELSPRSRTIKELEAHIGVRLFNRDRRGTHLTRAGNVFLEDVQRVIVVLDQELEGVKAAVYGHFDTIRVAISDGVAQHRLALLLALCRGDKPAPLLHISELTLP